MEKKLSRRQFLRGSAVVAIGAAVTACAQPTPTPAPTKPAAPPTNTTAPAAPTAVPTKPAAVAPTTAPAAAPTAVPPTAAPTKPAAASYKEAPMLADLVKAGKLPPVDQRLPSEPLVLKPVESIGKYGGKWTFMAVTTRWSEGAVCMANWCENFARWERDLSGHRPNVISKWAWNTDGTQITLFFRKGMKWSDGSALGADDWLFWYNDMCLDAKVKSPKQTGLATAGADAKAEKIDDQTLKLTFTKPNPLFIELMNRGTGARATSWQLVPSAYLKKFHYKYNTAITDTTALVDHYANRCDYPDMPHDGPWIVQEQKPSEYIRLTRNPYYWKVDTNGNQLPYMDGMECKAVKDGNLIVLSSIAGELDFQLREMNLKDLPVLKENAAKGNYRVDMWKNGDCGSAGILFHYCGPDKAISALQWNRKFRQAMSYAINKSRINDVVFLGLGRLRQIAMLADGPEFASPRGKTVLKNWEDSAIEYDVAKAKALLDEIGVKDVNNDGFREKPDGTPLDMIIDIDVTLKSEVEAEQLIKEDFQKVGLKWTLNVIDGTLLSQRAQQAKKTDSHFRSRGGSASGLFIAPSHWTPVEYTDYTIGGPPYGLWYQSGGTDGLEPPAEGAWMKKMQQIYGECLLIVDTAKRNDHTLDGYQVHIDEGPFQIGTVGDTLMGVVCKNSLKNVIKTGIIGSWVFGFPGTADPEQWYQG